MKKFYFLLIAVLISGSSAFSQSGWMHQNSNINKRLSEVFFINEQKGWIVTDSSKILKTTDGGLTWTLQTLSYYSPFNTIFFINENTGWAAGGYYYFAHSGVIYKTTNGGSSWNFLSYSENVQTIYFVNENKGFIGLDGSGDFGSGGSILKTTNGGINWQGAYSNYAISSISFKNSDTGFAVGHYWDDTSNDTSLVYRTTNGGSSWEIKYKERNNSFYFGYLKDIFVMENNVWSAGRDSSILYSSNNGDSWIRQYVPIPRVMNSIYFADRNTGWAVGIGYSDTTNIIKTTNGGLNWFNQKSNYNTWLYSVMFVNENTGWAAGDNGTILKTTTGGLTYINNNISQHPAEYILNQNYPNPFNPNTIINYELRVTNYVSLKVYNALGKEVATLVNEKQNAGSYNYQFSTVNYQLPSGIYFYKLEAGDFAETKRMVLIK